MPKARTLTWILNFRKPETRNRCFNRTRKPETGTRSLKLPDIKSSRIAIIGLGYVGLPLALEFAKKFQTIGFDINPRRIAELSEGHDRTREADASELREASGLTFTADPAEIADANIYIITVPTPIDEHKRPDLRPLISASETVGKLLQPGNVVIYESTVYPGCTEEDCVPILERESGLACAFDLSEAEGKQIETKEPKNQKTKKQFFAGYSPERINPGDREHRLPTIKKVTSAPPPKAVVSLTPSTPRSLRRERTKRRISGSPRRQKSSKTPSATLILVWSTNWRCCSASSAWTPA